jgi:hypothetical protein
MNLAVPRPKVHTTSSQTESKKITNNNSIAVKNRNSKQSQQKVEKLQTSQTKLEVNDDKCESLKHEPDDTKVKEEQKSIIENE